MLTMYPAVFYKDDGAYTVIFPDLNNLATFGSDVTEAMTMAVDCLAGYVHTSILDNETLPTPSAITDIDPSKLAAELECEVSDAFVSMVTVDAEEYASIHFDTTVERMVSLPTWLNDRASSLRLDLSALLKEAILSKIG